MFMSVYDLETSTMRQPRPDLSCCATERKTKSIYFSFSNTSTYRPVSSDCDWPPNKVTCLDATSSLFWYVTQRRLLLSY